MERLTKRNNGGLVLTPWLARVEGHGNVIDELADLIVRLAEYEDLEDRLKNEFNSNITLEDLLNNFIMVIEAKSQENLKGFRLLTNEDAVKYDAWKASEEALKGSSL